MCFSVLNCVARVVNCVVPLLIVLFFVKYLLFSISLYILTDRRATFNPEVSTKKHEELHRHCPFHEFQLDSHTEFCENSFNGFRVISTGEWTDGWKAMSAP